MKEKPVKIMHYGVEVWVNPTLEALRNEECLCFFCAKFFPDSTHNCKIAEMNYAVDRLTDIVTPVVMCPEWKDIENGSD